MSLHTETIAGLSAGLASGAYSSEELTRALLARIEQHPELNAFITITADEALTEARAADAERASGEAGPLTGVPIVHKDLFCTQDVRTTCGSRMLEDFISPYDAAAVQRLRAAGAVMLAKTNMDEYAMGSSNETSYFGPVLNPWDHSKSPGGSSGGSAAAVAARLVPGATGTDTGGSIRQPAALSGITGFKPTYGRVSRYGMVAFASSLDQAGTLTTTAEDAAMMLSVMAGFDDRDSTCVDEPVPDYRAELEQDLSGLRIGIPTEFLGGGLDPAVEQSVRDAIAGYESRGASVAEISLPHVGLSVPTYYVVAPAECSSNLSRFDGVRFGHRCADPVDLTDLYARSRGEGFGDEVKRRILTGTYVLSAGYYDAYYLQAQKVRQLIADDFKHAFEQVDVLMGPTAPTAAFGLGEKTDDPINMYLNDIYTIGANLAGLPAMSIPCGFVEGLPVGLQLIGSYFQESKLLAVAHAHQRETDHHLQIPAGYAG
jgi:aspartyl-tRNA(Asn)/glutamyl-tRNA(Gln) amidotransferase subunit A